MSEYAICLYFDNTSSERLMELMRIAADACGNKYMFEPKMMPPHITVCYFTADDITPIEHIISKYNLGCYTFALHFVTESACKKQLFHCAICSMK